jgi:hypothetical protein
MARRRELRDGERHVPGRSRADRRRCDLQSPLRAGPGSSQRRPRSRTAEAAPRFPEVELTPRALGQPGALLLSTSMQIDDRARITSPQGRRLITTSPASTTYTSRRARGSCSGLHHSGRPPPTKTTGGRAHLSRWQVGPASRLPSVDLDAAGSCGRLSSQDEVFHAHARHTLQVCAPPLSIVEERHQLLVFWHREFNGEIDIGAGGGTTHCSAAEDKKGPDLRLIASPVDKHMPRKLLHGRPPKAASAAMLCLPSKGRKARSRDLSPEAQ